MKKKKTAAGILSNKVEKARHLRYFIVLNSIFHYFQGSVGNTWDGVHTRFHIRDAKKLMKFNIHIHMYISNSIWASGTQPDPTKTSN